MVMMMVVGEGNRGVGRESRVRGHRSGVLATVGVSGDPAADATIQGLPVRIPKRAQPQFLYAKSVIHRVRERRLVGNLPASQHFPGQL